MAEKLCSAQAVLSQYGMLECKLCYGILLMLNMADIFYAEGCGVSSGECIVYLVGVNRLMCMLRVCGVIRFDMALCCAYPISQNVRSESSLQW